MKLKYEYIGEETPVERLRNKLQPLFFLTEMSGKGRDVREFPELVKAANDNLDEIRDHLTDVKPFYAKIDKIKYTQNTTDG